MLLWQCPYPQAEAAGGAAGSRAAGAAKEAAENRGACQAALLKAGIMPILVGAPLGDGAIASVTVRVQVHRSPKPWDRPPCGSS